MNTSEHLTAKLIEAATVVVKPDSGATSGARLSASNFLSFLFDLKVEILKEAETKEKGKK